MPKESLDKKGILKAMTIALAAAILAIVVLGWEYNRLAREQLPALEEKIEQNAARDVLRRFLETQPDILLTERAMEQKVKGEFVLDKDIKFYEITKIEKIGQEQYRFYVKVGDFLEMFTMIKVLGSYYVDSIETAG